MNPCTVPKPKREEKRNPRGRNTESERIREQEGSAASQEETPASHPGPTAEAKPEPDQKAETGEAEHDRRSGPQKPGDPSPITETDRGKSNKADAQARTNQTGNRPASQKRAKRHRSTNAPEGATQAGEAPEGAERPTRKPRSGRQLRRLRPRLSSEKQGGQAPLG